MTEVPGIDTIQNLVGNPPIDIPLERKLVESQQTLMAAWNAVYVAMIPYCYKCKVPLIWHVPPEDNRMFLCPSCGREWIMNKSVSMQEDDGEID